MTVSKPDPLNLTNLNVTADALTVSVRVNLESVSPKVRESRFNLPGDRTTVDGIFGMHNQRRFCDVMASREGPEAETIRRFCRGAYCFFVARVRGESPRVKITTSSPLTVLTSWWRLNTWTPVTAWTIASIIGRAVSIN
jgi:hypothetical protein